MSGSVKENWK